VAKPPLRVRLRNWAGHLKREVVALGLAARDPRVPWYAKAVALAVVVYALSPIDLIPDFIPVLGLLDDVILVPLGVLVAVRLIPRPVMAELRRRAADETVRGSSRTGVVAVVVVWIVLAALLAWWLLG